MRPHLPPIDPVPFEPCPAWKRLCAALHVALHVALHASGLTGAIMAAKAAPPPPAPLQLAPSLRLSPGPDPLPHPASGSPAFGASWPDLLASLAQAPAVREAQAQAEASAALSQQSEARAWWPRLDANLRADEQRQRYGGLASRTPSSAASVQATLPLWRPADRAEAQARSAGAEQARWQASSRAQALARELSAAYLDAVETAEHARLTRRHLVALQQHEGAHRRRLQAGLGTVLDLLETRTRQSQSEARETQLLSRLGTLTLTLGRLSGRPLTAPAGLNRLAGEPRSLALPSLNDALALAWAEHPEVQDALAGVRSNEASLQARHADRWQPTLDATASRSRTRQTQRFEGLIDRQDVRVDAVGLVLNWPLFSGGYHAARQREAVAQLGAAQARLDDVQARLSADLQDAYQRHEQARRQQSHQQAVVDSTQATLEAIRKAWLAGLRSTTDLLDAQQQVHEAELAWASARIAVMQTGADALALIGALDARHVAPWLEQFDADPVGGPVDGLPMAAPLSLPSSPPSSSPRSAP